MIRTLLLAAMLLPAGVALATPGPLLIGGGSDTAMVDYQGGPMGSLVGGGTVMLDGGAMDRSFSFGRVNAQPGRSVTIVGGGDNQQIIESPAAPRG